MLQSELMQQGESTHQGEQPDKLMQQGESTHQGEQPDQLSRQGQLMQHEKLMLQCQFMLQNRLIPLRSSWKSHTSE